MIVTIIVWVASVAMFLLNTSEYWRTSDDARAAAYHGAVIIGGTATDEPTA